MIRSAERRDIEKITELLVQVDMVHHEGRPDLFKGPATKYTKAELEEIIRDENNPVFVYVSEDGEVKGHAFCNIINQPANHVLKQIKTLYIDDICVDENARGQHIGKALYDFVVAYAKEIGCYNVTLNVWECNQSAGKFYEAMGMHVQKTGMEIIL